MVKRICTKCCNRAKFVPENRKLCIDCLDKARKAQALKRAKYKTEGRCACGRPVLGKFAQCKVCRDKFLVWLKTENFVLCSKRRKDSAIKEYRKLYPQCAVCGFSELIEIHHKDHDRNNKLFSNLISLCPNHHKMLHKNLIFI